MGLFRQKNKLADTGSVHILIEIAIATFVVLIFAEFIPRAIFRARSNILLSRLSLVTDIFYQMFSPVGEGSYQPGRMAA